MLGIYVSYDEKQNGNFDEAVYMSNDEYLLWKDRSVCKQKLNYPANILIKIKGREIYYRGTLLLMRPYLDFNSAIFAKDIIHRPSLWRRDKGEAKTVFIISGLKKTNKPFRIANVAPMQRPIYIDF